jgi:hypothetical protein
MFDAGLLWLVNDTADMNTLMAKIRKTTIYESKINMKTSQCFCPFTVFK